MILDYADQVRRYGHVAAARLALGVADLVARLGPHHRPADPDHLAGQADIGAAQLDHLAEPQRAQALAAGRLLPKRIQSQGLIPRTV
jgi:hypothetical protein